MPVLTIDKKPYSQDLNTPDRLEIEKWEKELTALEETLLSIAGHELRTPLTVVKALGELLQQNLSKQLQAGSNPLELEALTTRNLSYLARLLYQLDRIEVLINQWLDGDSLKQTRFTPAKSYSFNLVDLVKRVVEQHKLIAFQHSLRSRNPRKWSLSGGQKNWLSKSLITLFKMRLNIVRQGAL
ncbi:MAG TPA: histidine kinase dimerization/phospho-acceptor domain-containing protein [Chloroflexia bacterium]|nr:histidine kinase dimerization/phospho-acceptor domain-containing protein [Chloroflexia bacterium]